MPVLSAVSEFGTYSPAAQNNGSGLVDRCLVRYFGELRTVDLRLLQQRGHTRLLARKSFHRPR
jgi:hypothetical protein